MTVLTAYADPQALIPGDADDVDGLARELLRYADGAVEAAGHLRAVEAGSWVGPAADAFRGRIGTMPRRLDIGADAFADAARALRDYASELREARRDAAEAIDLMREADAATAQWHAATVAHEQAAQHAEQAARDTGRPAAPVPAGPSRHDPGAELRDQARHVLDSARDRLEMQGDRSASALRAAQEHAPDEPGLFSKAMDQLGEFFKGAGEATVELGEFAFKMQPVYLLIDPAGFFEHKKQLLDGIVYGVQHPKEFAKAALDWETWKENPARALGHLVPDLALALATAGAGTAGSAASRGSTAARRLDDVAAAARRVSRPTLGDGSRRPLYDQLMQPRVHPSNAHLVDFDRDPLNGLTPDEFLARYQVADEPGGPREWDWPPDNGAVPGTKQFVDPSTIKPDRIGSPDGTYFGESGDRFHTRSLPPDRLNFSRADWDVDVARASEAGIQVQRSKVAPWFEQPGGGSQYQFVGADGKTPLTQRELEELEIIRKVSR